MGMTINNAENNLAMYEVGEFGNAYLSTWYKGIEKDMEESFKVAIDTMTKYQKIQEIITNWKSYGGVFEMSESYWLKLISEVLEDGNNNQHN